MMRSNTFGWFAKHELLLFWRDLYAMLSANRPGRGKRIAVTFAIILAGLHLLAWAVLQPILAEEIKPDLPTLVMVSGFLFLPVSLMASQAMESITRAFYTRSDLELILGSPAPVTKLFLVRMLAIAITSTTLTLVISAPAIIVLSIFHNAGWLLGFPVILSFGLLATSFAILLTMGLFALAGPARTRMIAQIASATVGAGFVIGIQLLAITSIGSISRFELFRSELLISNAPDIASWIWIPARGTMGDPVSALVLLGTGMVLFAATVGFCARHYARIVLQAASIDMSSRPNKRKKLVFRKMSAAAMLRHKEWKLLLRDKWLLSQTLMQLFYLIPPAYMLWHGFGGGQSIAIVVVPVIVMATGQLAGGLAWLAISGEDAPELVTTAPVSAGQVVRAKVEAVLTGVGLIAIPLLLLIALISTRAALIAGICIALSVVSATAIQLWFKAQAKRSSFRRRQTSSRMATMAEAFSSILWAGTAGLWIGGSVFALGLASMTILILCFTWWLSPARLERANDASPAPSVRAVP